jgi:hypothetical protein
MKRYLLWFSIITLGFISCQQEDPGTPQVQFQLSADEQAISGDWILDQTELYLNGALYTTTPHNDPVNCHLNLQAAPFSAQPQQGISYKNCLFGLDCNDIVYYWYLESGKLALSSVLYTIVSQTSTTLILQRGTISQGGGTAFKYYLHK